METKIQMTTISLRKETVQRLGDMGHFGESYEDVIARLLEIQNQERQSE